MARAARRPPATSTARHAAAAVLVAAAFHRLLALSVLLVAGAAQSSFDASGEQLVLLPSLAHPGGALLQPLVAAAGPLLVPLVRWDTLHYLGAASPRPLPTSSSAHLSWWGSGYAYEHTLAFQPGLPALLRWAGRLGTSGEPETWQIEQSLVITTALAVLASALAPVLLVLVTNNIWARPRFALLTGLISIWSPSPATLISPTPEPFFAFFTLVGLWILSFLHRRPMAPPNARGALTYALVVLASVPFLAIATLFRANGILAAGFLLWYGIWWPVLLSPSHRPREYLLIITAGLAGATFCVAPFLLSQVWAHGRFCVPKPLAAWCGRPLAEANWTAYVTELTFKSIYSYVQSAYWEVGFLRYWTLAQLPNFLLAAPVLYLILYRASRLYWSSETAGTTSWRTLTRTLFAPWLKAASLAGLNPQPSLVSMADPAALPFLILMWATGCLLLFDAHVQIALRFASPAMIAIWWTAALILANASRTGQSCEAKILMGYLVCWNFASLVLYAGFYPPA